MNGCTASCRIRLVAGPDPRDAVYECTRDDGHDGDHRCGDVTWTGG